jgi:hypothetical protein
VYTKKCQRLGGRDISSLPLLSLPSITNIAILPTLGPTESPHLPFVATVTLPSPSTDFAAVTPKYGPIAIATTRVPRHRRGCILWSPTTPSRLWQANCVGRSRLAVEHILLLRWVFPLWHFAIVTSTMTNDNAPNMFSETLD